MWYLDFWAFLAILFEQSSAISSNCECDLIWDVSNFKTRNSIM
jgi:hypothetical protein